MHKRKQTKVEQSRSGTTRIRVLDGNQIDSLLWSDHITPEEHSILTGFQVDAHRAGLLGLRSAPLEARVSGAGHDMSDKDALCFMKHMAALRYVMNSCGPAAVSLLQSLCLDDKPVQPDGLATLRQVCSCLAQFRSSWSPDKFKTIA